MVLPPPTKLKSAFKNARTIPPLYTGGPVALTPDARNILTCLSEHVILTDITSGNVICRFAGDTQEITSFCITPSSTHLAVFTTSMSLRVFEIPKSSTSLDHLVQPIRTVARAHDAPVHVCKTDPTSTYLASGSADGVVKVWDIVRGYITHVFKGHGGVVSALTFSYPQDSSSVVKASKMQLITGSVDTRIRIFDLSASTNKSKPQAVLEGHVSVPRGLDVSADGKWLISGGRDSVVLIWDLSPLSKEGSTKDNKGKGKDKARTPSLIKTIPILERVEAVGLLHPDEALPGSSSAHGMLRFYTGGERGAIKVWDGTDGNVLCTLGTSKAPASDESEEQRQIVDVMYVSSFVGCSFSDSGGSYAPSESVIVSIHADQNILFHSLSTRSLTRHLVGYNDEIVDASFLTNAPTDSFPRQDTHLALATNSSLIRVYSLTSLDTRLLDGHREVVLTLDHSPDGVLLASGSKDKTARIWAPFVSINNAESWDYRCIAVCEGHAESVGTVAFSKKQGIDSSKPSQCFFFTGSQDRTIKMWDVSNIPLSANDTTEIIRCKSLTTQKAHDKDINSLDVSPNDRLLASGSQDRTVKIFEIEYVAGSSKAPPRGELKLIGTCKGHKRGIWTVRFSRTERVLATGSGDKSIKLWNIDDFTCVKTFEGHTNSVLRVDFVNMGMQLVSSASDGLVKLWNIREEECMTTLDNHEDKVWALTVSSNERTIVSGAADSVVTFWEDCTEEQEAEKEAKRAELVLKEQDLMNYLALNDYKRAIELALAMEQPGRLLSLFKDVQSGIEGEESSITGHRSVDEVLKTIGGSDLVKLLRYARDWNTSAKTSSIAQTVLHAIFKQRSANDIANAFGDEVKELAFADGNASAPSNVGGTALKELVDAILPYSERHMSRLENLVQESYMVDYVLSEMDGGIFGNDLTDDFAMEVDSGIPVQIT
ncbi:hypothetical protein AMATHDRAFT_74295 [Amanita thiersii Skay4041]|uniref:U3 small nucleolar RNA-associated protein 13 C-terminal domain-containing protein n=1 Tax=Amanita thiersii Skay4041 TaxID=703135 RepID=A0A2A9NVA7_9AGAR|nr:hypothetical protein AMATHDRAFT_74295 [Amanita thiersii Skay4041]